MSGMMPRSLGKYSIIEEIGRGGMAVVYKAVHKQLGRYVAIKVLPRQFTFQTKFVQRFHREATAASTLSHPNIVIIYDVDQEDDIHYIVMEYLEGQPLSELIKEQGSLPLSPALKIIHQISSALDYAHSLGFVHRAIKPSNIIIGPEDHATLTDFGIVRTADGTSVTKEGAPIGTPEYMSPEQCDGKQADSRSDVYSLGAVLYEMVTGQVPFTADTPLVVMYQQVNKKPVPPRRINPDLSVPVEGVVLRALAKTPEERYPTAGALAEALEAAIQPLFFLQPHRDEAADLLPRAQVDAEREEAETTRLKQLRVARRGGRVEREDIAAQAQMERGKGVEAIQPVDDVSSKPIPGRALLIGLGLAVTLCATVLGMGGYYFLFREPPAKTAAGENPVPTSVAAPASQTLTATPSPHRDVGEGLASLVEARAEVDTVRSASTTHTMTPSNTPTPTSVRFPARAPTRTPTPIRTPTPTGLLLSDDLDGPGLWGSYAAEHREWSFSGGQFHCTVKHENLYAWHYTSDYADFEMTMDVAAHSDQGSAGLAFRVQSAEQFYMFLTDTDGHYCLRKRTPAGGWETIVDWQLSTALHTGQSTNHLKLSCLGDSVALFANGQHLTTVQDQGSSHGGLGPVVGSHEGQTEVQSSFDNLGVWSAPSSVPAAPTQVPAPAGMVYVEGGTLELEVGGSVNVSPYYIDSQPVTWGQYGECVDAVYCGEVRDLGCDAGLCEDEMSMHLASWLDADRYCAWAEKRLPTLEEWAYSCLHAPQVRRRTWLEWLGDSSVSGDRRTQLSRGCEYASPAQMIQCYDACYRVGERHIEKHLGGFRCATGAE